MIAAANSVILSGWTLPASLYAQRICRAVLSCATLRAGARHTSIGTAAAAPAASGALLCTNFGFGLAGAHFREGCGMAVPMCLTPASPPYALDTHRVGSQSRTGAETMSKSTRAQRAPATTPKTTREPVEGLSFFIEVKGPRGAHIAYDLNFPDEPYFESSARGYAAAAEMLAALEARTVAPWVIYKILELAHKPRESFAKKSDRGACSALREVVFESLSFAAKAGRYTAWLESEVAQAQRSAKAEEKVEQQRIQRSIEARRARQAARKAAIEGGAA